MAAAGTVGASLLGACIPVLDRDRPLLAGPLLVCVAMMVTGLGTQTLGHQWHRFWHLSARLLPVSHY